MGRPRKHPPSDAGERRVRLLSPYRFHDDDGHARHWHAGETATGMDAELLIERKAPVEVL